MRLVIPAVNYADYLSVILPRWKAFLPSATIVVVTAPDDPAIKVAEDYSVPVHITDIWTRPCNLDNSNQDQPVIFNKAGALNEAFGFSGSFTNPPDEHELCLSIDCDVVPFGSFPVESTIKKETIYGCPRYHCRTPEELEQADQGKLKLKLIPPKLKGRNYGFDPKLTPRGAASRCLGYFQLFRHRSGRDFGNFATAGGYDLRFRDSFPHKTYIECMHVLHLGDQDRANWKGRVIAPWPEKS